jgi:DNA-binding NarL/FixJ family response regulator
MHHVVIVHEHRVLRESLAFAVGTQADLRCVGTASTLDAVIHLLHAPDVDSAVAVVDTLDDAIEVRSLGRAHAVLVVEEPDAELIRRAQDAHVAALLSSDSSVEDILSAIRVATGDRLLIDASTVLGIIDHPAVAGDAEVAQRIAERSERATPVELTPREHDVLALLGEGLDTQQIARKLGMSVHTARGHVKSLLVKLDAHTQLQAVVQASRAGLLNDAVGM